MIRSSILLFLIMAAPQIGQSQIEKIDKLGEIICECIRNNGFEENNDKSLTKRCKKARNSTKKSSDAEKLLLMTKALDCMEEMSREQENQDSIDGKKILKYDRTKFPSVCECVKNNQKGENKDVELEKKCDEFKAEMEFYSDSQQAEIMVEALECTQVIDVDIEIEPER